MNRELQSEILNRDARGVNSTILLAKTNKEKKANVYNVYYLTDSNELKLLFHSANFSRVKSALACINGAISRDVLSQWVLGYRCSHVKFVNLSE